MRRSGRALRMARRDRGFALATILPALIVLAAIYVYPLIRTIGYSFTDYNLINHTNNFVGWSNYGQLFTDPTFYTALVNTLALGIAPMLGAFLLGFAEALILNEVVRGSGILRGLMLLPWVVPQVVIAYLFRFMYNPTVGVFNVILRDLGIIGRFQPWLAHPATAPAAVVLAYVWNETPFFMLMLLAGLQSIPGELIEAAVVDGAGWWQRLWFITLPQLRHVIAITTILTVIWNFNNFTIIWPMTEGGPANWTLTFSVWVYRQAFQDFNLGYAATIGVLWLALLLVVTGLYLRIIGGREQAA
ncbi:MAG: carbohydrate ABC transporter permease [Acetobacteraceae bacterium]